MAQIRKVLCDNNLPLTFFSPKALTLEKNFNRLVSFQIWFRPPGGFICEIKCDALLLSSCGNIVGGKDYGICANKHD